LFYSLIHHDDRDHVRAAIEAAVEGRGLYDVEYRTVSSDGRERWIRAKGRVYRDAKGEPTRFDGVTLDISGQKQPQVEREAVLADASRLQQIVWNLVSNAIKFTSPGGLVTLCARRSESEVVLTVSDDGAGITAEFLPHVFERFRQAESNEARTHGGLGLGLAIVRQLVELHGGKVEAASAGVGRGATFSVRL